VVDPPAGTTTSTRAALLAAAGQLHWPPTGNYMTATGQDLMAADISDRRPQRSAARTSLAGRSIVSWTIDHRRRLGVLEDDCGCAPETLYMGL
jgi:hypothetical protein